MINSRNTTNQLATSFSYWLNFKEYRRSKLRYSVLKKITKKSLPLFFKGGDIISLDPLANGNYELEIKELIEYFANNGFNHFLIDIGANIGLSSCQSGMKFNEVHMFEPNPNCVSILKINSNIALRKTKYIIHEYGLGSVDETLQLFVPYDNWGGAFVKSNENEYDEDLLSSKDGYGAFNSNNYDVLDVQIKSSSQVISDLFANLLANQKNMGVIKIDAEGYEKFIVNSIIDIKPELINCVIIFENWKKDIDISDYFGKNNKLIDLYKLENNKYKFQSAPRWFNSLINSIKGGFPISLKHCSNKMSAGTYLLIS